MTRDSSRRVSWFWVAILVVALLMAAGFAAVRWSIHSGVREATEKAVLEYPGDGVLALAAVVDSESHARRDRNRAVWALGQLRDPRALPVLERHRTGGDCDHSRGLCQYELTKAIDLIRSHARP